MHVAVTRDHFRGRGEIDLAIGAADPEQLRAAGKKLRRAAFIRLDVRTLVTKNAVKRPAKLREGERVGPGAVEDEKGFALSLENLIDLIANPSRPAILAIRSSGFLVGLDQGGPGLRTNGGGIVAGEFVAVAGRHKEDLSAPAKAGKQPNERVRLAGMGS